MSMLFHFGTIDAMWDVHLIRLGLSQYKLGEIGMS
ncbi:hypothetical protein Xmir_01541 [Xenorhabdus miraniensis]|uniref:Uncharacterized protein n=1 Tax=Xenorhabdus miraniensis TaxID=351674 RepID=A0A2D0JS65_9GAMM|nr:hypothetical protein Xmir_01541 [Xenorhabdus miraniensis]